MSYADIEIRMLLHGFEEWFRAQKDYADSTVYQTLIDVRLITRRIVEDGELRPELWRTARHLRNYLEAQGVSGVLSPRLDELCDTKGRSEGIMPPKPGSAHTPPGKKREHRSVDDESWRKLYALVTNSPVVEARVLEVMMITGLRIGDVLRFQRREVTAALGEGIFVFVQKGRRRRTFHLHDGPLRGAIERLVAAWPHGAPSVAHALVASGIYMSAYNRVDRFYKKLAGSLPGRAHTHRLRRTVATQTWRETKDLRAVASMLGHATMITSQRYIDELAPDEIEETQSALHDKYMGEEDS